MVKSVPAHLASSPPIFYHTEIKLEAAFPELNAKLFLFLITFLMCVWMSQLDPPEVTRVGAY